MKNPKPWLIKEEEIVYRTAVFDLKRRKMKSPSTEFEADFYSIISVDWVNILAITKDDQAVMIRQFRHGIQAPALEIPGGMFNSPNEDPQLAAERELLEETGYTSSDIKSLGFVHNNPAIISNRCHLFVAKNCKKTNEQDLDPAEDINIELISMKEIPQLITDGKITHSLVISTFHKYLLTLDSYNHRV